MANSVDPDQIAPIEAVCSWSTLFASILNSPFMLGNYLQQTTSADDIFICIFCRFFEEKNPVINLVYSGRAGGRRAAVSWLTFWLTFWQI